MFSRQFVKKGVKTTQHLARSSAAAKMIPKRTFMMNSRRVLQAESKEGASTTASSSSSSGGGILPIAFIAVTGGAAFASFQATTDSSFFNTVKGISPSLADALKQEGIWSQVGVITKSDIGNKSGNSESNVSGKSLDGDADEGSTSGGVGVQSNAHDATVNAEHQKQMAQKEFESKTQQGLSFEEEDSSLGGTESSKGSFETGSAASNSGLTGDELELALEAEKALLREKFERELKAKKEYYQAAYESQVASLKESMAELEEDMEKEKKAYEQEVKAANEALLASQLKEAQEEVENTKKTLKENHEAAMKEYENNKATLKQRFDAQLATEREERINTLNSLSLRVAAINKIMDDQSKYEEKSTEMHRLWYATFLLARAVETDNGFSDQLKNLQLLSRGDELMDASLASIGELMAETGVSTLAKLTDRFSAVQREVRIAMFMPQEEGSFFLWRTYAKVMENLTYHEEGLVPGEHPEAIVARAEFHLKHGNLSKAVEEMDTLPAHYAGVTKDWINTAKRRLVLEQTVDLLNAHIATKALSLTV
eukprot:TRINITY_DN1866_c0_g2_i1.p1 TRINITY_DN1866_c0_g2~~TRINITY_DN1866_c0_g2_i1.p1  ORF type:complete len:601 (-),score=195.60 TRINITY_DN1866_c0_g2_i1:30-1652(-)